MILSLFLLLAPALVGIVAIAAAEVLEEKITIALVGGTLGVAVFTTAAYVLATFLPLLVAAVLVLLAMTALTGWAAWQKRRHLIQLWHKPSLDKWSLGILIAATCLFMIIAPKLLITRPDGLYTGIINAYGDVAWHMSNIATFAAGQSTPPENPIFAGTRLTYPFLTNFLSAILLKSGATFAASVDAVALFMIPILLTLFYSFTKHLTNNKRAAVLAMLLFLFGGAALGWIRFNADWQESHLSLVEFLTHLPARDYSGVGTDEQGFHFLNPTTTLLLPQRSFLFALPLAFIILLLLLPEQKFHPNRFLIAGVTAGILPLFHAHTVLALLPAIVSFFAIDFLKSPHASRKDISLHWIYFVLPALIVGIPEVLYYIRGDSGSGSFLRWGPRWMAGEHNLIWYWFINTGFLIPAAIAGIFLKFSKPVKALAVSGLIIFVIANLFLFAPWAWDNFKLFVYFLVFILPIVSLVAIKLWDQRTFPGLRAAVLIVVALHMLPAGLDIWKLTLPTAREWQEWDKTGVEFAQAVQDNTKAGERVLTAANHNSPIVLAGRPRYLGFAAHVWSHGGDPWTREKAVKEFYEGRLNQLPDLQPTYVVVSPQERSSYPNLVIRPEWKLVTQVGDYQLYKL